MSSSKAERQQQNLHRLIMVSDGVFAIAMTLLAIEIHPPEHWTGDTQVLVNSMLPMLSAYAISFAAIGGYWVGHRRAFSFITHADGWIVAMNFLVLALVALLPAGVELIYANGARGIGLTAYLGLIAAIGAAQGLMWGYAVVRRLVDPAVTPAYGLVSSLSSILIPVISAGSVFYALGAKAWWPLVIAVAVIVVLGGLRRRLSPDR
jgi:uncharacterized membrane protein